MWSSGSACSQTVVQWLSSRLKVAASDTTGKDTRDLTQLLLNNMVVDLLKVDPGKVTPETSFTDLGADSLDMVELLMSIEDTFEAGIPESFNVLVKEMRSLGLNVELTSIKMPANELPPAEAAE